MPMPKISVIAHLLRLMPLAVSWVETQEAHILATGRTLTEVETRMAAAVGVRDPGRVRIKLVGQIPAPDHPELQSIASETGLIGPRTGGITFGHGIYVRDGHIFNRLVSHELRHVHQYEAAGSIDAFLKIYLRQIATVGYERAPLELDARRHERNTP
jgi:hypothetical protein